MAITFFIGNGFDLNIGLETKYDHFLKWYKEKGFPFLRPIPGKKREDKETLAELKKNIYEFRSVVLEEFKNWSDLEIALGQATKNSFFTSKDLFLDCKYDLDLNLQCYLSSQNKRAIVKEEDCSQFVDGIVDFLQEAPDNSRQIILNAWQLRHSTRINVVSFNYTDVVGDLFNQSHKWPSIKIPNFTETASYISCSKGEYLQIHGRIGNSFILGVDNTGQIARQEFQNDSDIQNACVKRNMHIINNRQYSTKLVNMIYNTTVFCVFGMSIGKTDRTWWHTIGTELKTHRNKIVIIYALDDDFDTEVPYVSQQYIDGIKNHFCEQADLSKEIKDAIFDRIIVIFNSHIFDLPDLKNRVVQHNDMDVMLLESLSKRLMPNFKPH